MLVESLLVLHVSAGAVALIGMAGALLTRKGGERHRLGGRVYAAAMCVALGSALLLAVASGDVFIGLIAVFSAYFLYTGWRLAAIRDRAMRRLDRVALGGFLVCTLAMFGFAAVMFAQREGLAPVLVVFGLLSLGLLRADWRRRGGWPAGVDGVALHLSRMGGATIATLTAVFVVNVRTDPEFIAWLAPSAVLIPTFLLWSRRLQRSRATIGPSRV